MSYLCKFFSYMMFWGENMVFILVFLVLELLLATPTYLKIWFNLIKNSLGLLRTILNCLIWAVIGIPMMLWLVVSDIVNLIRILCYH